jgi:putative transposase
MSAAPAIPGHPLHVIRRGLCRQRCFFSAGDRIAYLEQLTAAAAAERCGIHAYVMMENHVHLLVTPARSHSVVRLMRSLASPLWETRFEAWPVYPRRYLLECMRYIELNPVRAGMVLNAGDYRWSSFAANALGEENPLLTPHPFYVALGRSKEDRRAAYRAWFARPYAPRTVSTSRSGSAGKSSARQATWPSGRTSTSRRS